MHTIQPERCAAHLQRQDDHTQNADPYTTNSQYHSIIYKYLRKYITWHITWSDVKANKATVQNIHSIVYIFRQR